MATKDLTAYKGVSFDIIGTLIDFEAGILKWCRPRLPKGLTDNQILESFARVEKSLHVSFAQLRQLLLTVSHAEKLIGR